MTVWLIVIGAYVLYWAHFLGGLDQAAFWIKHSFKFNRKRFEWSSYLH